jgi:hypothetical protein
MWSWWATLALGASPRQTEVVLDRVQGSLERVRSRRVSPQLIETLPGWVDLTAPQPSSDPGDLGVLREAVSSGRPLERALAARWLAAGGHPDGIVAIEPALGDARSAGWLPQTVITQQLSLRPEVQWVTLTVGEVALRSLAQLVGEPFESAEQYQQWRASHPEPARAPDVWSHAVRKDPALREALAALEPELSLRVRLLDDPSDALRAEWRELVGPARTEALISGAERWPEHDSEEAFGQFVRWAVFELDLPALQRLWAQAPEPRWTRTALALALGRAEPSRREEVLTGVLADPASGPVNDVLAELVRHHVQSQQALLVQYLSLPDGTTRSDHARAAILHALAEGGPASRDELVALLGASRFASTDPRVVEALARAARQTGLVDTELASEPCAGPFAQRPSKNAAPDVAELTDLLLRRRLCVAAVMAEVR